MLIEPTPALPPSRSGRARLLTAILVPAVLLVGVVGVGVLTGGAKAGPDEAASSPTAEPIARSTFTPPSTGLMPRFPAMAFPADVLDLPTRTVSEVLGRRRGGDVDDGMLAVFGYLTVRPGTEDCFIGDSTGSTLPMIQAVGCRREVLLSQSDEPLLAWSGGQVVWRDQMAAGHLHIAVFQAVSLGSLETLVSERPPTGSAGGPLAAPIRPRPVIVIGRFDDPRLADPRANDRHVNESFTLERVAWTGDVEEAPPPIQLVAPPPGALSIKGIRDAASGVLPGGAVVLSHAYLPLDQLVKVDAAASGKARNVLETDGVTPDEVNGVWYVRAMVPDDNLVDALDSNAIPRRLGWVVLTADGAVLALAVDGFSPD